jgi:rod shape-determining protein MreD
VRALRFLAVLVAALIVHLVLVALVPPAAQLVDPFLLAIAYLAMTTRPGAAAAGGAAIGLVHDALSGALYGMHGFTATLVGWVMAKTARLVDLQKSYYIALYFACAVLLQQLVLQGLLLLLMQRPEPLSVVDLALRVVLGGPAGALLVAGCERLGETLRSWKSRRRAEIVLD